MKIEKVAFRRLRSFGEYENMGIEVEASVGDNETPEEVFAELQKWGAQRLAEAIELPEVSILQVRKKELEENLSKLTRECWEKSRELEDLAMRIRNLKQSRSPSSHRMTLSTVSKCIDSRNRFNLSLVDFLTLTDVNTSSAMLAGYASGIFKYMCCIS